MVCFISLSSRYGSIACSAANPRDDSTKLIERCPSSEFLRRLSEKNESVGE